MAFNSTEVSAIPQRFTDVSNTAQNPVGSIVRGVDPTYGAAEFIYLPGVTANVAGSVVYYDLGTPAVILALATANMGRPLAVSMSAATGAQYGWYQISGVAVVQTNGTLTSAALPLYLAGAGQVTSTSAAGKQVVNAVSSSATGVPAAGLALATIQRPFAQGAIT